MRAKQRHQIITEQITKDKLPELINLARRAHEESRYSGFAFSEPMVADLFHKSSGQGEMGVMAMLQGEITGFFLGGISTMAFSQERIGIEHSFYVRPESRGTRSGIVLMKAFLNWCEQLNIPAFVTVHYAHDNERTYRFCERMGMSETGRVFRKG